MTTTTIITRPTGIDVKKAILNAGLRPSNYDMESLVAYVTSVRILQFSEARIVYYANRYFKKG